MATAAHTFVEIYYEETDGTVDHEEFELPEDLKVLSIKAYRKEVETA